MRIVFKVIAIIGILSFLGGLKNGVFFIFGLILAGIFGYFGWRPEKNLEDKKDTSNDKPQQKLQDVNNELTTVNSRKTSVKVDKINLQGQESETDIKNKIEENNKKLELLTSSYDDGLFSQQEFKPKKEYLELEIAKLTQLLNTKITTKKVIEENKELFARLSELKTQGIITNDEYNLKYKDVLTSLLNKVEFQSKDVSQKTQNELPVTEIFVNSRTENNFTRKKVKLIWLGLFSFLLAGVVIFYYIFQTSSPITTSHPSQTQVSNDLSSENEIANEMTKTKNNVESPDIEKNELSQFLENTYKDPLDRIYLGTNLFHEGSGGTWGRATISKKLDHYWIEGEHKMSNGDWVKIEGSITNPSIEGFTFQGKISAYSPSSAKSNKEYGKWEEKDGKLIHITNIDYPDTCVWVGKTEAYKLFKGRKYWRIKSHDCYSYTTDIDIFHN